MEEEYGFTITSAPVKVIETDSVVSYTMLIHRDTIDQNYFENLVVTINSTTNATEAQILKYNLTSPVTTTQHNSGFFTANIESTPIIYNDSESTQSAKEAMITCVYVQYTLCDYGGTTHVAGENCGTTYLGPRLLLGCSTTKSGGGTAVPLAVAAAVAVVARRALQL